MNKLVPISIAVLLIIIVVAFGTRKKSKCVCSSDLDGNINCSKCNLFNFLNVGNVL